MKKLLVINIWYYLSIEVNKNITNLGDIKKFNVFY